MNLIIMELQNEEINAKKINAVKDATYAVAKTKPEKKVLSFVWTKGEYNMWNSSCNMLTMNSGVIVTQLHFIK